jgi:hypothetical protein
MIEAFMAHRSLITNAVLDGFGVPWDIEKRVGSNDSEMQLDAACEDIVRIFSGECDGTYVGNPILQARAFYIEEERRVLEAYMHSGERVFLSQSTARSAQRIMNATSWFLQNETSFSGIDDLLSLYASFMHSSDLYIQKKAIEKLSTMYFPYAYGIVAKYFQDVDTLVHGYSLTGNDKKALILHGAFGRTEFMNIFEACGNSYQHTVQHDVGVDMYSLMNMYKDMYDVYIQFYGNKPFGFEKSTIEW